MTIKLKLRRNVWPIITVVAIVLAVFFYLQVKELKQNPQTVTAQETSALVAKVSKLVLLPTNETPTIATVSDPSALVGQSFFDNAQKGDKVLIYSQAKKAILYSVSLNKIINIAPLNIGAGGTTGTNPLNSITTPTSTPTSTTTNKTKPVNTSTF